MLHPIQTSAVEYDRAGGGEVGAFPAACSPSLFVIRLLHVSPCSVFLCWSPASFPSSAFPRRRPGLLWGGTRREALILLFSFSPPRCQTPTSSQAGGDTAFITAFILIPSGSALVCFTPTNLDYHRLRVGGLILAAVLCLIGITILLSGHCRCKFNQNKRRRTGSNAQQMLNDQGTLIYTHLHDCP
uniref:FXYD domain-containing ion transport regulator n=1 Tax=Xiphophorus couchianus TaxID=32473 RepID=A0A3B5MN02_9TELE